MINLASIGGVVAVRDRLAYTVTKHAVVGLTRSLALDHSHTGVRFNAICPGRVETPFVKARIAEYPDPAQAYRDMSATQLTGRMAGRMKSPPPPFIWPATKPPWSPAVAS